MGYNTVTDLIGVSSFV